jgi:hypothetical protein
MNQNNYKETYVWNDAIELVSQINRLIEDLPEQDQGGLGLELRRASVELPAMIAADLLSGIQPRLEPALRVDTQLEVVSRIYPALDTAVAEKTLAKIWQRMRSGEFNEVMASEHSPGGAASTEPELEPSSGQEIVPDSDTLPSVASPEAVPPNPVSAAHVAITPDDSSLQQP